MVKIKNLQLIVVVAIMMIGFTACDKATISGNNGTNIDNNGDGNDIGGDDNGGGGINENLNIIEASNIILEEGNDNNINQVKIIYESDYHEIASAPYQNHGFKITLPANVDNQYLGSVVNVLYLQKFEDAGNLKISDKNANCFIVFGVFGYKNNYPNSIGIFMLGEETKTLTTYTCWMYVNKDVNVQGSDIGSYNWSKDDKNHKGNYIRTININCKKGWNIIYISESNNETYNSATETYTTTYQYTYSSQKPSNANLKWYGYIYDYNDKVMPKSKFGKNLNLKNIFFNKINYR